MNDMRPKFGPTPEEPASLDILNRACTRSLFRRSCLRTIREW